MKDATIKKLPSIILVFCLTTTSIVLAPAVVQAEESNSEYLRLGGKLCRHIFAIR